MKTPVYKITYQYKFPSFRCSGMLETDTEEKTLIASSVEDALAKVKSSLPKTFTYLHTKEVELICHLSEGL